MQYTKRWPKWPLTHASLDRVKQLLRSKGERGMKTEYLATVDGLTFVERGDEPENLDAILPFVLANGAKEVEILLFGAKGGCERLRLAPDTGNGEGRAMKKLRDHEARLSQVELTMLRLVALSGNVGDEIVRISTLLDRMRRPNSAEQKEYGARNQPVANRTQT